MTRVFFFILLLGISNLASWTQPSQDYFQFVISGNATPEQIKSLQSTVSVLILKTMKGGDILTIVDADSLQETFHLKLNPKVENRPEHIRHKLVFQLHPEMARLGSAFTSLQNRPFQQTSSILRLLRNVRPEKYPDHRFHVIWVGSPIPQADVADKINDFRNSYPGDGSFATPESVWYTGDLKGVLKGVQLHIIHSPDLEEFTHHKEHQDLHQKKLRRVYAIYMHEVGGSLVSFGSSADLLRTIKTADFQPITFERDPAQTRPQTIEFTPSQIRDGMLVGGTKIWTPALAPPKPLDIDNPKARTTGPVQIGLRFRALDNPNIDLDIHTQLIGDIELSFRTLGQTSRFGGKIMKDFSQTSQESFGHETVIYPEYGTDLRHLKSIGVNHYSGQTRYPIECELRVMFDNIVYTKTFKMQSPKGDQGAGPRNGLAWTWIDIREVLGTPSELRHQKPVPLPKEKGFAPVQSEDSTKASTPSIPEGSPQSAELSQQETSSDELIPDPLGIGEALAAFKEDEGDSPSQTDPSVDISQLEDLPPIEQALKPRTTRTAPTLPASVFYAGEEPANVFLLLDTSGSMHGAIWDGFFGMIENFWKGKTKFRFAQHEIEKLVNTYPQHTYQIGTYATEKCQEPLELFDLNSASLEGRFEGLSQQSGSREHLVSALKEVAEIISKAGKRSVVLVLGDLEADCSQTPSDLCMQVDSLKRIGAEVQFFSFTLPPNLQLTHSCLEGISTDLSKI